ncbi:MAG TPA: hypothetical protein VGF28_05155 [Thermoanaerobaculia bacterium]
MKLLREKSRALAEPLREPEIIYIIGQGDIAMAVGTTDFRRIADLGYPGSKSRAGAVNWVFSVPYVLPELPPPDPEQRNVLRFMLHLRLRRHVYAYRDGEEQLVHQLAALLNQNGIPGRIHVGLGWSDLIVEGTFSRDSFNAFVRFMIFAHGLRFEIGPPDGRTQHPAIQRMLTVIGYVGKAPDFPGVQHMTFVRAVPGGYDDLTDLLEKFGEVHILDGKADFMIGSEENPPADWLRTHSTLGGDRKNKRLLQKVETHLVYLHASQFDNQSGLPRIVVDFGRNRLHRKGCNCEDKATAFGGLIEKNMEEMEDVLPREQAYAVTNVLFLLGATLRDTSICCDARDAVFACYHGLLSIFVGLQEQGQLRSRTAEEFHGRREQLAALWRRLDEWHRFTDLLLRQRTVGSFEELLGQTDRSVCTAAACRSSSSSPTSWSEISRSASSAASG